MASDEIVWQVINHQFCAFKLKTTKQQNFCRNEHNVTGLCNRQSCPLANSRYATIRSDPSTGTLYLYTKTIERSHTPSKLWERTALSPSYSQALSQIDRELLYWPKFLIHKCKQRLTRLTQVAIRTRRLAKEEERLGERVVPKLAPKVRRREETRERKAHAAARVERAIERELIERLRSGAYGDRPLNVEEGVWKKVLRGLERDGKGVRDEDLDEGIEEEEVEVEEEQEAEMEMEGDQLRNVEYVSDLDEDEDEDEDAELADLEEWLGGQSDDESASVSASPSASDSDSDDEDTSDSDSGSAIKKLNPAGSKRKRAPPPSSKRATKGPRMEIEYDDEVVARDRDRDMGVRQRVLA